MVNVLYIQPHADGVEESIKMLYGAQINSDHQRSNIGERELHESSPTKPPSCVVEPVAGKIEALLTVILNVCPVVAKQQ
jgi:hypothetical protein